MAANKKRKLEGGSPEESDPILAALLSLATQALPLPEPNWPISTPAPLSLERPEPQASRRSKIVPPDAAEAVQDAGTRLAQLAGGEIPDCAEAARAMQDAGSRLARLAGERPERRPKKQRTASGPVEAQRERGERPKRPLAVAALEASEIAAAAAAAAAAAGTTGSANLELAAENVYREWRGFNPSKGTRDNRMKQLEKEKKGGADAAGDVVRAMMRAQEARGQAHITLGK